MATEKRDAAEMPIEESGELHDKFTNHWSVLYEKGYIGLQNKIRVI